MSKNITEPSQLIDEYISEISDWRGEILARIREIFHEVDAGITEEWKWMGSPVWSHDGIIAVGNAHKKKVKLTFYQGANLADPDNLFNASLGGKKWRAIDFFENDEIKVNALKNLIQSAISYNKSGGK